METEFIKILASGGAGAGLVFLLFYQMLQAQKAEKFERERYISRLEAENAEWRERADLEEKPTRPIRYAAKKA